MIDQKDDNLKKIDETLREVEEENKLVQGQANKEIKKIVKKVDDDLVDFIKNTE